MAEAGGHEIIPSQKAELRQGGNRRAGDWLAGPEAAHLLSSTSLIHCLLPSSHRVLAWRAGKPTKTLGG